MTDTILNIAVGTRLELESTTYDFLGNMHSEFIGCAQNKSIILAHPKKDNVLVQVDAGDRFFVSLKLGDADIAFETEVITVLDTPYPHLHTTFPKETRTGPLRESDRVSTAPADVHLILDEDKPDIPISIMNISVSGASLAAEKPLGVVDDQFLIAIQAGAGQPPVKVDCMIRHIQDMSKKNHPMFHHGVVFIGMDAEVQLFLWKFVQESTLSTTSN